MEGWREGRTRLMVTRAELKLLLMASILNENNQWMEVMGVAAAEKEVLGLIR